MVTPLDTLSACVAKLQKLWNQQRQGMIGGPPVLSYSECIRRAGFPVFLRYKGDRRDN